MALEVKQYNDTGNRTTTYCGNIPESEIKISCQIIPHKIPTTTKKKKLELGKKGTVKSDPRCKNASSQSHQETCVCNRHNFFVSLLSKVRLKNGILLEITKECT